VVRIFARKGKRNRLGVLGTDGPDISVCRPSHIESSREDAWEYHLHCAHVSILPQLYPVLERSPPRILNLTWLPRARA
jgi:hypothetical protein